jgi:hypothetical protein
MRRDAPERACLYKARPAGFVVNLPYEEMP